MKTKILLNIFLILFCFSQFLVAQKTTHSTGSVPDLSSKKTNVQIDSPCPIGAPSNPNPPDGTSNLPLTGNTLSWTNGNGTLNVEVWFGPTGNIVKLYDGPSITSYALPNLVFYGTTYYWYIICKDDTCGITGPTWSFTTMEDPNLINITIDVYPQNANYWTGTCDFSTKTQVSLVNAGGDEVGWMVFDVSPIIDVAQIVEVEFHGYLYANNWPYWSITPMGNINPVTDDAGLIFNQISNNYQQGVAYSFNQESGTLVNGWLERPLGSVAEDDLQSKLISGWFAIGIVDWDFTPTYFIDFLGWAEINKPFLRILYSYCLTLPNPPPSNLTAQVVYNPDPQVQLNWQDNTSFESGFRIYRKYGYPNDPSNYELIGIVQQNVTQFFDGTVTPDSTYTYRVFAFNSCGSSSGSNTATIAVPIPVELISFTADVNKNFVNLFWQTATETNNQGFEIERLQDSKIEKLQDWVRIGFVAGKGTTTEMQSYSFTDNSQPGIYKYRLKQIDFDGTFAYSPEIEAEVKAPNIFSLEQNYPNPFNPSTVISYQLPVSSKVELKVYDVLGNEVATLVNGEQTAGEYEIEFNTSSIKHLPSSGIYFYQLKAGSFIETKKMILLK